jgi:hypothetical protein
MADHQRLYKKNMTVVRMLIRIDKVGCSRGGNSFKKACLFGLQRDIGIQEITFTWDLLKTTHQYDKKINHKRA